jgi:hypothetical protein
VPVPSPENVQARTFAFADGRHAVAILAGPHPSGELALVLGRLSLAPETAPLPWRSSGETKLPGGPDGSSGRAGHLSRRAGVSALPCYPLMTFMTASAVTWAE